MLKGSWTQCVELHEANNDTLFLVRTSIIDLNCRTCLKHDAVIDKIRSTFYFKDSVNLELKTNHLLDYENDLPFSNQKKTAAYTDTINGQLVVKKFTFHHIFNQHPDCDVLPTTYSVNKKASSITIDYLNKSTLYQICALNKEELILVHVGE